MTPPDQLPSPAAIIMAALTVKAAEKKAHTIAMILLRSARLRFLFASTAAVPMPFAAVASELSAGAASRVSAALGALAASAPAPSSFSPALPTAASLAGASHAAPGRLPILLADVRTQAPLLYSVKTSSFRTVVC